MTIGEQKDVIRRKLMQQRQSLQAAYVNDASQKIVNHLINLVPWNKVRCLHTYAPIESKKEVDTWPLLRYVWEHQPHVTALAPTIVKQQMINVAVDTKTKWHKNKLGVPEPTNAPVSVLFHQFDIIIVPAVGFDKNGYRLGYGQGYYDKFLTNQPHATTIGLAYANSEVKLGLPVEPHDVRLDCVVTEDGVLEFRTKI